MDVWVSQHIKVWIADQIAVVSLNRPDNRNAMTYPMWRAIPGLMRALERNPEVRTIILTGTGEDFCAGADIPEFEKVRADVAQATAYEVAVDACCDAIAGISKPTIAVVKGYCLGGGAHLAMSCDFRYAAASAVFGIPAARLSIIYGVRATQKLCALVGQAQAKRILYSADRFTAPEALRIGFVDHVSGSLGPAVSSSWWAGLWSAADSKVADPMADARTFARKLAANAPLSIAGAKYILTGLSMGPGDLDLQRAEELIAFAAGSEDYREGRKAFAEKRPPGFKGF
ncbi:3-hydroxybutyryl-CoA dehydratase [Ramlibacter sp. WS9]|nr:3-hydroxybutyryl-CoA dehydratase [Ramlibacter sp. WS9]